jgi:hypothetical protein
VLAHISSHLEDVDMPGERVFNVLFLCTHNSARSIMAEVVINYVGRGRFKGFSAGSHPATAPNPFALATLQRMHFPTDGLYSKNWEEFAKPDALKRRIELFTSLPLEKLDRLTLQTRVRDMGKQ